MAEIILKSNTPAEAADILKVQSGTATSLDVVAGLMEIS